MNIPTLLILLLIAAIAAYTVVSYRKRLTSGCCGAGGDKVKRVEKKSDPAACSHHWVVMIDGMHCENCAARVENAFNQEDDLTAKVSLGKRQADVYARENVDEGRLRQLVAKAGYLAGDIRQL